MIGIDKYQCLKSNNYTLEGDFYSQAFSYVEIKVWQCVNETSDVVCKSHEEIDDFFNYQTFSFAFINSLFSKDDYENPIQYYIDDSLFFEMEAHRVKSANFYVMKSELELEDSMIQFGQEVNIDYYQVQNYRTYDKQYLGEGELIELFIRHDRRFEVT
mmetsp:Transcript_3310/g.3286  ORF Transcript_3310/g.3286 Transcript_3310/m.3286 type:complete len:158 (+) Transcript_3310:553-1026(+)